jgi:hypothetical protein
MRRGFALLMIVVLCGVSPVGCGTSTSPPPLTPEQERQLEQQLEEVREAEGAMQEEIDG